MKIIQTDESLKAQDMDELEILVHRFEIFLLEQDMLSVRMRNSLADIKEKSEEVKTYLTNREARRARS